MANLKNRINRLTKLRGPVEQKGINSLDLFLVGALAGLYSKRLIIENVDQGHQETLILKHCIHSEPNSNRR